MPMDPTAEPRSAAALGEAIAHFVRAGAPANQLALQDRAWTMLEIWTLPDAFPGSRLANEWLGEKGWLLQVAPQREMWKPEWVIPFAEACARRGHVELFGTAAETGDLRHSAVWRVPTNADDISRFFESHYACFSVLFPADLSFAIHCTDGDFATYAGPESFLREALPPEALGPRATAAAIAYVNPELTEADWDDFLAPYRPFMIA
jgi:hypothetical protein